MVNWFSRKRKRSAVPTLRSRSFSDVTTRVDLAELTPDLVTFLGKAAYLQLVAFENLSAAIIAAPTADAKENLSQAASLTLARQHALSAELVHAGRDAGEVMNEFAAEIDEFKMRVDSADWFESLITCHITAGFIDDFLVRLAAGLPNDVGNRVTKILEADAGASLIAAEITAAINTSPQLASRLAMWGRRLVGDTMLIARYALEASASKDPTKHDSVEARIEPVFTELIASHTRRMDALGLTA